MALAPSLIRKICLLTHTAEPPSVNTVSRMCNKYDFNMTSEGEFPQVLVNAERETHCTVIVCK